MRGCTHQETRAQQLAADICTIFGEFELAGMDAFPNEATVGILKVWMGMFSKLDAD